MKRSLTLHIKPVLRDKPLPTITRVDIVAILDRMPDEQVGNRRNVLAVMRRLFRWAISRGDIALSPMEGMETPPPVKPRERWLTDKELAGVWTYAPRRIAASVRSSGFRSRQASGAKRSPDCIGKS